ncbi:hypothetical protein HO173_006177 [Letharia columbiana]|uniref:N-acetyltransferase domain-containing protein n=1 Tax=Letharia columbiana TaxID=112416 RepID=A0A8H6FVG1_9LECA|nr:uncharacterized protein HO173_006177 [Letharia columbiana]KAF6235494.1 hypothetical protein HO173_006177 [Letharia columbiana]
MPAMLEDPTAPAIYRVSGNPPYPTPDDPQIPHSIVPRKVTLRDRITIASLLPFSTPTAVPARLLSYLCSQLNLEIEKGDTYPMMTSMSVSTFGTYWFQNFGAIMLLGEVESVEQVWEMEDGGEGWEKTCLGSFYVKPNYPGRSSHICNGGFLVTEAARNKGVGRLMGEGYLEWAPKLGYTYSVFNLVYETNVASCRIWDALGFKRIGRIPSCGNLRSSPNELVEAIVYGRSLGSDAEDIVSEERFDKIRYYLKHGTYPSGADRAEKSRLRSAATHYKLVGGEENGGGEEKLMLKDKEVVSDPQRQYQISKQVHAQQHGGINKTTATIAERFHWVRIKETVSLVIKNCPDCKDTAAKAPTVRPMGEGPGQFRKAAFANGQNGPNDPNSMIERLVNFDQMDPHPGLDQKDLSISRSPEMDHHAPTAMMRRLQDFNGIPVDPQIDPRIIQQQHGAGHYGGEDYTGAHRVENRYVDLDMDGSQHQHLPMAMATERHVRKGDEPTGYQTQGMAHEARMQDGNAYKDERMHDGDDYKTEREIDFQELLRNS